nr:hypothetical protein Hi04_10k_c5591_00006 [uncultured bacterium]
MSATREVQCFVGGRGFVLDGADPELTRDLLAATDGRTQARTIVERLSPRYGKDLISAVLSALVEVGALGEAKVTAADERRVVILGNHELGRALDGALERGGFLHRTRVHVKSFARLLDPAFRARLLLPLPELDAPEADRTLENADVEAFVALLGEFDLAVVALEGLPNHALLEVNRAALVANVPCLFVTPEAIGPLVSGGAGPCFACRLLQEFGPNDAVAWALVPTSSADAARAIAGEAVFRLADPLRSATYAHLERGRATRIESLLAHGACPVCRDSGVSSFEAARASCVEIGRSWPVSPAANAAPADGAYRSVGIVGGGTAGFLAALSLRKLRPELTVTLIESSAIPVIGVGEATTPELVKFLHSPRFLDRDVLSLYDRVQPTYKLGIKFQWGPRDFTFPFQRGRLLESKIYEGDINAQSLGALLMQANRGPVFRDERGNVSSLAHLVRWAYHLENRRFVRYLHEEALASGIELVDARIVDAARTPSGDQVAALVADDGRRFEFDLYIDCSGFRSLLLEQALGARFSDWSSTLFNDRAVTGVVPHNGTVKPYTLAETMNAGWCWNIPFEDADHRGYVFSSTFLSPEQAEREMRDKNPGMREAGLVKFRSGRHDEFWKGNVVAIGNSYAFVEPLESTAIHMIVLTLELLTTHFPSSRHDTSIPALLNRKVAARWDALRWFLGTHFRYNTRLDTDYWRKARAEADISGAEERVGAFRERAPLSYRSSLFYTLHPPEFFSDDHSFDTLLVGQDVPARYLEPVDDRATFARRLRVLRAMQESALPHAEALTWLREHPAELGKLKSANDSWLFSWVPA